MSSREIVLGTDSGTFWTDNPTAPWSSDPHDAQIFASPRDAWNTATRLRDNQAEYLEDSAVELHVRDPEDPRRTSRVASTALANNRPALRVRWRHGFGEPLPLDLPRPVATDGMPPRLAEYLRDVDWDELRRAQTVDPSVPQWDPSFQAELSALFVRSPAEATILVKQNAPADIAQRLVAQFRAEPRQTAAPFPMPPASASRTPDHPKGDIEVNEISRVRERPVLDADTSTAARDPFPSDSTEAPRSPALPGFVRRHFVRAGDRFYYRQNPDHLAFTTRGETFRANDPSVSVATAMVELAQSRGWSALRVQGSKEFRRLVWAAAAQRGLAVEGYSPGPGERAMVEQESRQAPGDRGGERGESRSGGRPRDQRPDPMTGRLVARGPAPFQHQPDNSPSYFVSLRDASGAIHTRWGLDLERAIGESGAAIGDQVQLARVGKQSDAPHETARTTWSVTIRERPTTEPRDAPGRQVQDHHANRDRLAARVVDLFTAERLGRLVPEDQARFRDLYEQAKARLQHRDAMTGEGSKTPIRNEITRDRNRERAAMGR